MKKLTLLPLLLSCFSAFSQAGYEIKVTLKPFANQYVYLGHYSGKQYPIVDSVKLNAKSEGVFRGKTALPGGIYLIAYPSKNKFIEILIDKKQHFSLVADTADIDRRKFTNSADNVMFAAYQAEMRMRGRAIEKANTAMKGASPADSTRLAEEAKTQTEAITAYRKKVIADHPTSFLAVLMRLMEEPKVPPGELHPGGKYDSVYAYQYYKRHYWDGIEFFDDRVTRTPASLFEDRLDKYYNTIVYPAPDSVIRELDYMLGYASVSQEMTRVLLVKFVTRYLNMKYMWEDAVFVHLFQKYFANKDYSWLTPQGKKMITERAYSLMANIMGNPAENISLPDTAGTVRHLYTDTAKYTMVCFWDPTCGHCKETLPVLDSMYHAKWKALGLKFYAVGKQTDGTHQQWLDFIRTHHLGEWTHVYYSKEAEKNRIDANIPGYSQLYDAQTVPAIYLLDREKRIIAKKLTWQQADEILTLRSKTQ